MRYSSFKTNPNQPSTYLDVLKIAREKKGSEDIITLEIEEPNFTRVLQGIKDSRGINVYTDDYGSFDEIIEGVHFRFRCVGGRMRDQEALRYFKGQNNL